MRYVPQLHTGKPGSAIHKAFVALRTLGNIPNTQGSPAAPQSALSWPCPSAGRAAFAAKPAPQHTPRPFPHTVGGYLLRLAMYAYIEIY